MKKKMKKELLKWLNYLAVAAGIVAVVILAYGIIRSI